MWITRLSTMVSTYPHVYKLLGQVYHLSTLYTLIILSDLERLIEFFLYLFQFIFEQRIFGYEFGDFLMRVNVGRMVPAAENLSDFRQGLLRQFTG